MTLRSCEDSRGALGSPVGRETHIVHRGREEDIEQKRADRVVVDGLVPGTTYFVRLQAIRSTALGAFVVAESDVLTYTAP